MNTTQYIEGMSACKDGEPCPGGSHPDFERGYSAQYAHEQNMNHESMRYDRKHNSTVKSAV